MASKSNSTVPFIMQLRSSKRLCRERVATCGLLHLSPPSSTSSSNLTHLAVSFHSILLERGRGDREGRRGRKKEGEGDRGREGRRWKEGEEGRERERERREKGERREKERELVTVS